MSYDIVLILPYSCIFINFEMHPFTRLGQNLFRFQIRVGEWTESLFIADFLHSVNVLRTGRTEVLGVGGGGSAVSV